VTRAGRFNPFLAETDPFKRVFSWRKSQHLTNVVFTFGLLNDGRSRNLVEQARGAVFTHTQNGDTRFDDIANAPNLSSQRLKDISSFEETLVSPPELVALLNPADPLYPTLSTDPFYTVSLTTRAQQRGEAVFAGACMSCHNMPNVFSNKDHVDNPPLATPLNFGHVFDIGVAQKNALQLDVRPYDSTTGGRGAPIVVPLVKVDGTVVNYTVTDDIGAAADTGRYEDLHRFKVPQLRLVSQNAPYFHDNSAPTLEAVVDYFNSDDYNRSADGIQHPIHLREGEKSDLVAFLKAL
jgi:cytochrome c peroxidase